MDSTIARIRTHIRTHIRGTHSPRKHNHRMGYQQPCNDRRTRIHTQNTARTPIHHTKNNTMDTPHIYAIVHIQIRNTNDH